MKLAILIITFDLDCLHILLTNYIYFQSGNAIDDFIGYYRTKWPDENILLKLQILLKKRRLGFVRMVSRVESRFTMSSINTKLCNVECSNASRRFENILEEHYRRILQKEKRLNSKIDFAGIGKQARNNIAKSWAVASFSYNQSQTIWD